MEAVSVVPPKYRFGFVAGAFDLLHVGYVRMFAEAKTVCRRLVVALHVDPSVEHLGKPKPVQSVEHRREVLMSLRDVDEVIAYATEADLERLLRETHHDVRILGDDYRGKSYTGESLGKPVYYCSRAHGVSASLLKKKVVDAEADRMRRTWSEESTDA